MNEHTSLTTCRDDLGDRLHRADFVVAPLQMHERGVRPDRSEQRLGIDSAGGVDADDGHLAVGLG